MNMTIRVQSLSKIDLSIGFGFFTLGLMIPPTTTSCRIFLGKYCSSMTQ